MTGDKKPKQLKKKKNGFLFGSKCDYIMGEIGGGLSTIDEEVIFEKIKELDSTFKKTEYNANKYHHHNKDMMQKIQGQSDKKIYKIKSLKKGEVQGF